jgi:transposase InsO family protein
MLYGAHLNEAGILASTGSVGDWCAFVLAESVNGACTTELIRRSKPFGTVRDPGTATFPWVSWWNGQRLHQRLGYRTSAEVESCVLCKPGDTNHPIQHREQNPVHFTRARKCSDDGIPIIFC